MPTTAQPSAEIPTLPGYQGLPGRYDECMDASGRLRGHWGEFFRLLGPDPRAAVRDADAACRRAIIEQDVSMNVYAGENSASMPWPLDSIPLLIGPEDWKSMEAGLRQRARLFERLLQDLYGPQDLLRQGDLPAALAMANPQYLRACAGLSSQRSPHLHAYAADLARSPDGRWWVLDDRLDAPSGLGYSLQNRVIVRQALPRAFKQAHVHRLHRFFRAFRSSVESIGSRHEDPLVVFLTPGPANETYFEHAYLARYLGYPLVEGADLTTRDQQVYLRTVGGLRPVGTIVRRVDSESCDPLELDADSVLGVPGLANAAVNGTVNLANQLGGGALEGPGLLPFLAPLCRKILDEELSLPNAATWWCGHRDACDYVLANLSTLVVKSAFRGRGASQARYGALLGEPERDALAAEIRARPWAYCGQERVLLGTTPAWVDNDIRPVPFTVRVYLAWSDGEYRAMPGGLTRFNTNGHDAIVSMQQGGVAKDTWVLSGGRPEERPPPLRSKAVPVVSGASSTPSRLADDLFWLGRYLERTTQLARMFAKLDPLANDEISAVDAGVAVEVARVLIASQEGPPLPGADFEALAAHARALARNRRHRASLSNNLEQLVRITAQAKAKLPPEVWRIVRGLVEALEAGDVTDSAALREQLSVFKMLTAETLPHDTGWRFLELGRRIERAHQLVFLSRGLLADAPNRDVSDFRLQTLLHFTDNLFMYRSVRNGIFHAPDVFSWLVSSEENPRGLRFQAEQIALHVEARPSDFAPGAVAALRRMAFQLVSFARLADPAALARSASQTRAFLADAASALAEISDRITQVYLVHAESPGWTDRMR